MSSKQVIEFVPAILEDQPNAVLDLVNRLKGLTSRLHLDFADGTMIDSHTALPAELLDLRFNGELDAHLMVNRPTDYFSSLAHIGFTTVILHFEAVEPLSESIIHAKSHGFKVGLALNPDSSLHSVEPYVSTIDFLQLMGVDPGYTGQPFLPQTFSRLEMASQLYPQLPLAVDGGVRLSNAVALVKAGAKILVASRKGFDLADNLANGLSQWNQVVNYLQNSSVNPRGEDEFGTENQPKK